MRESDFAWALNHLKDRMRVRRTGWNGVGMWLILMFANEWSTEPYKRFDSFKGGLAPFVALRTADGQFVPWAPSQTDLLAEDWEVVP